MTATVVDPAQLAETYRAQVRADVAALGSPLRIVGLLSEDEGPAATYARYAQRGCAGVGIDFELRHVAPDAAEHEIGRLNADESVHGVFLYYPILDPARDRWLRELVDPRKDVEGMHSFWSRLLYENTRFVDAGRRVPAVLPCTPLAVLKLLEDAGLRAGHDEPTDRGGHGGRLGGVTACIINRSDIVGRPLSAMLANDGALVHSLDLAGAQVFERSGDTHAHTVRDSHLDRAAALADADVVITGVPSRDFPLVRADEIKPGAICVNFSQFRNFADDILDVASAFVPRVGPMTVTMAMRNAVQLRRGVQQA